MKYFNMTRSQAIEAMKRGFKVRHEYFTQDEYLHMPNGMVITEDGYYFYDIMMKTDFMEKGFAQL